jgi:hypothetical protein
LIPFVIVPMWVPVCGILIITAFVIWRSGVILPHLNRSEQRGFEVLGVEKLPESELPKELDWRAKLSV